MSNAVSHRQRAICLVRYVERLYEFAATEMPIEQSEQHMQLLHARS